MASRSTETCPVRNLQIGVRPSSAGGQANGEPPTKRGSSWVGLRLGATTLNQVQSEQAVVDSVRGRGQQRHVDAAGQWGIVRGLAGALATAAAAGLDLRLLPLDQRDAPTAEVVVEGHGRARGGLACGALAAACCVADSLLDDLRGVSLQQGQGGAGHGVVAEIHTRANADRDSTGKDGCGQEHESHEHRARHAGRRLKDLCVEAGSLKGFKLQG
mmetsp:Transcript_57397/g.145562  ORF Transcript_57397/g.145562 Transcript_57397/m.145562 type:complete len:215 (-) Transcript_57397:41-685(-)